MSPLTTIWPPVMLVAIEKPQEYYSHLRATKSIKSVNSKLEATCTHQQFTRNRRRPLGAHFVGSDDSDDEKKSDSPTWRAKAQQENHGKISLGEWIFLHGK